MLEEREIIRVPLEDGAEEEYEVLYYFDHPENGNKYMFIVPFDEEGNASEEEQEVLAVRYTEDGDDLVLHEVETDEEWDMLEEVLDTLLQENL